MKKQESQKTYTYRGVKVILRKETYRSNSTLAIQMIGKDDEELYGTVTVNLSSPLQSDTLAFVDCNNMPGIEKWLQKNGLAISLGFSQRSGFCTYPLMMFTLQMIKTMRRETLNALGIHMGDIDARVLMDEGFNGKEYGLNPAQCKKIRALRDFLQEYKGDLSKPQAKVVKCCQDAVKIVEDSLRGLDHEELWCAFLNKANIPVAVARMSSGGLDCTPIDSRIILKRALAENATGLILYHNHPSGNPHPGTEDIRSTETLRKAAKVFEISLLDHIVISDSQWFSFAEEQVYKF